MTAKLKLSSVKKEEESRKGSNKKGAVRRAVRRGGNKRVRKVTSHT